MLTACIMVASVVALASGIMVAMEGNPVVAAMDLAVCLVSIGAIYLMMDAYTLAAIQVFVYAGAVVVLFLFVIMLLSLGKVEPQAVKARVQLWTAPVLAVILAALLASRLKAAGPFADVPSLARDVAAARPADVGRTLLVPYLYPFEVASVLLLVAMVASLVIAKRRLP
jgi:NADH-quinone oxidoreductase subunit J